MVSLGRGGKRCRTTSRIDDATQGGHDKSGGMHARRTQRRPFASPLRSGLLLLLLLRRRHRRRDTSCMAHEPLSGAEHAPPRSTVHHVCARTCADVSPASQPWARTAAGSPREASDQSHAGMCLPVLWAGVAVSLRQKLVNETARGGRAHRDRPR
ncbi:hypothetical protein WOLCODRAFT_140798 [Wolfiporia cocos MD-104 SS10]|uniref:Uncharacterized protein n=1 Tax=Wolfiporia cocos (strain MD-104) TaxID=742152 RepID=A0A2H3J6P1_WOLCO|nr:hypothetical protein WOLCODRAFT_140798 [Wolfiporia cocos MD-104 SS10]